MRLGRSALELILAKNVVELRFRRRLKKLGFNDYRRMLCTTDINFLQSAPGKYVFHFIRPTNVLKYKPASKNLVVAFDLFMQNWRMINCDDVDVVATIQTTPDPNQFWKYFFAHIKPMSAAQKLQFMNQ